MGTRNLIAVQKDGQYKIAQYGQWDGYPSGQGLGVLSFLLEVGNIDKLKTALLKVRFVDNEKDKEFLESYNKNAPEWSSQPDNRTPEQIRWFDSYITRNLGSEILSNVANSTDEEIILKNSIDFAGDSIFCEYAYVIDFDKNTFEVFEGFNKVQLVESDRFFTVKREDESSEYYQVKVVKSYDLDKLPSKEEFLKELEPKDEE